ncbi:MAG: amidohydrolase [Candidatus Bathyarchaeia archaeon]
MFPDFILYNGKIITVDEDFSIAEAVAIWRDRFIAVGSDSEVRSLAGPDTRMLDLKRRTVIPGLIDSHVHITMVAPDLLLPSLEGSTSIADIVKVIEGEARRRESGEWIVTRTAPMAYISSYLRENRFPTRWDLDPVSPNNPVYIGTSHRGIVNSYALKILNITKDTPQPDGGKIEKDPKTGEPTGGLIEAGAMELALRQIPSATQEQRSEGILRICRQFNEWGITSVLNLNASYEDLRVLQELRLKGELTLRIYNYFAIDYPTTKPLEEDLKIIDNLASFASYRGFGDEILKIGGIGEIIFNGVMPREKLKRISIKAAKHNLRVGVHAVWKEKALDELLDLWEEVNEEVDITDKRFHILHGTFPIKENIKKIKRMKLVVSCQPSFLYSSYNSIRSINPARKPVPLKFWLENSVQTGLSTDYPYGAGFTLPGANPMYIIYYAVTGKDREGKVHDPDQVISREDALRCYTIYNAYITFEENLKGSIEPGKLADLVVLDKDILTCEEEEIKEIKPLMTMVGGKVVYERR